jgi:hypothetical protein
MLPPFSQNTQEFNFTNLSISHKILVEQGKEYHPPAPRLLMSLASARDVQIYNDIQRTNKNFSFTKTLQFVTFKLS